MVFWCFDNIFIIYHKYFLCPKCNVKYFITWLEYIAFFWDVSLSGITWNTSRFLRHGIKKSHFIMKECEVMQPESFSQRFSRSQIQSREKNFYDKINLFIFHFQELKSALNMPAAASFKHVSPAGELHDSFNYYCLVGQW